MEEQITDKSSGKRYFPIIIIVMLVFLIWFAVMAIISPAKKLASLREEFGLQKDERSNIDERILTDSVYLSMLKEKAFLQSLVAMAETDSLYLAVNLPDSILSLEISGVSVMKARIKQKAVSKILRTGDDFVISALLSRPLDIINDYSSIRKEPLMIKMAPRDTSEYQPDIVPDTAEYEPVNFILVAGNGLNIFVYQEKIRRGDGIHRLFFDMRDRFRTMGHTVKSMFTFKVPEYNPYIKIIIPRADARRIYRALPRRCQVAVCR